VVATPGRLLDHLSSKRLKNFKPHMVILDEADEMLDMGFIEDIRKILTFTPNDRQTMLFSATIPAPIARLARESLKDPKQIKLVSEGDTHKDIEQRLYVVKGNERESALLRLMEEETPEKAVVFCRTRRDTIELHEKLTRRGFMVQALHGDLSQDERTRAMESIKRGRTKILVATDVASRGLDIKDLSHVINYQLPECSDRYTHRIGRTGRAGNKGMAISFVTPTEFRSFNYLRHALNNDLKLARIIR
jgi:ATP-dependent RNA helicase DeaD